MVAGSLIVFYTLFALLRVRPGFVYAMGLRYQPGQQTTLLELPRVGGLYVDDFSAAMYPRLISVIQQHSGACRFMYAGPDSPQIYFLTGLANPTPTMFDFFEAPRQHDQRILKAINTEAIQVVALNLQPDFSPPLASSLRAALNRQFPHVQRLGRFEVRWR
jgi:hypothetical protein